MRSKVTRRAAMLSVPLVLFLSGAAPAADGALSPRPKATNLRAVDRQGRRPPLALSTSSNLRAGERQGSRPPLPPATSIDVLRPSGRDDGAALQRVLSTAGRRGGVSVVRLSGTFTVSGAAGLHVPAGVRVEGPVTIRFTNRNLESGALNLVSRTAVVDLTLVGPWERKDYDPHGLLRPGFNSGGGPGRPARDVELRRVAARGFAGAGFNSGSYVGDLRIFDSVFAENGDAGVQIGSEVRDYRLEGNRATGNRNNGFDLVGSRGRIRGNVAVGNGRALTLYPDGSSDVDGFHVWAATSSAGRHDAVDNLLEGNEARGNAGRGFSVVGGTRAAVRNTVLRNNRSSGNGGPDFHVQGNSALDGLGDNRGTVLDGNTGDWLHVQRFGGGRGHFVAGLRVCRNAAPRVDVDSRQDQVSITRGACS